MIANYAPATERLSRAAWSRLLWWRFRLFQRHRHNRLVVEHIGERRLVVLPDVINPKLFRTGEFLADSLHGVIRPGTTVLDMGTGSGIGAIVAAGLGARVTAVDINPEAVRCARINALLNRVDDRVEVLEGDLFEPVSGRQFDVVVFNPPYLAGRPRNALDGIDKLDIEWYRAPPLEVVPPGCLCLLFGQVGLASIVFSARRKCWCLLARGYSRCRVCCIC